MPAKVETDILANVPGLEDEIETTTTTQEGGDGQVDTTSQDDGQQQQQQSDDRGGAVDDTTGQQQQQQPKPAGKGQQQQPVKPAAQQQQQQGAPRAGDLVGQDGKVIARAGAERRFYEDAARFRGQVGQMQRTLAQQTTELNQLKGKVQAYDSAANAPRDLGLTAPEAVAAARLFADFKRDPVKTLKFLLGEVQAMGHNVEGLSDPNVQMHSIARMIDQRLQPVTAQAEQVRREQAARDDAARQTTEFFGRYPDAQTHDAAIGALCERDPQLSPTEAYYRLREHYIRNGLDWSVPLEEHNRRAQQGGGQQQQQQQQQRQPPRGQTLPNGRGGGVVQTQQQRQGAETADAQFALADENDSWESIIRGSMRNAGMRV